MALAVPLSRAASLLWRGSAFFVRLLMVATSTFDDFWRAAQTNPHLVIASLGLGVFVAFCFFKPFFGDWSGFWDCMRYWFTPDLISMFRGVWDEDRWATMKLFVWFALSVGTMLLAYYQLPDKFPHIFHKTA